MDLPNLRRRQRIGIAASKVIEMRANDDVFACLARKIRENVIDLRVRGFDIHLQRQLQRSGKCKRVRLAAVVDLLLDVGK